MDKVAETVKGAVKDLPRVTPPAAPTLPAPEAPVKAPASPKVSLPPKDPPPLKPPHKEAPAAKTRKEVPAAKIPEKPRAPATPSLPRLVPSPSRGGEKVDPPLGSPPAMEEGGGKGTQRDASASAASDTAPRAAASEPGETAGNGAARPEIDNGSLDSAKVAPLGRFFAYVWPAVALGPVGTVLATLQERWEGVTSLPLSEVVGLFSGLTGAASVADLARESGVAGISDRSGTSRPPDPLTPPSVELPDASKVSLVVLLISCAAVLAWLAFTVRRQLHAERRWPS